MDLKVIVYVCVPCVCVRVYVQAGGHARQCKLCSTQMCNMHIIHQQ